MKSIIIIIIACAFSSLGTAYGQNAILSGYKKAKFTLDLEKEQHATHNSKAIQSVSLMLSSNANDSLMVFIGDVMTRILVSHPINNEIDFRQSTVNISFKCKETSIKVFVLSLKQKKYVSFKVQRNYKMIRVFVSPETIFITKTNSNFIIE